MATGVIFRVTCEMTGIPSQQGKCVNVFHLVSSTGTPTLANVNSALGSIQTFYSALATRLANTTNTIIGTRVISFNTATPLAGTVIGATPLTVAGSDTNSSMPARTCAVISWNTGLTGRTHRGRTYISGIGFDVYTSGGGQWNSTMTTSWTTAANGLVTGLAALTPAWSLNVYSRKLASYEAVTSGICRARVNTQRGRG